MKQYEIRIPVSIVQRNSDSPGGMAKVFEMNAIIKVDAVSVAHAHGKFQQALTDYVAVRFDSRSK